MTRTPPKLVSMPEISVRHLFFISTLCSSIMATPLAYNFTVSAASPLFTYTPSRSGPIGQTWNASWSDPPWSQWTHDYLVANDSTPTYSTSSQGARLEFGFPGTALWMTGIGNNYRIDLDGVQITSSYGTGLYSVRGLENKWHDVQITCQQGGTVRFQGATFLAQLQSDGTPLNYTTVNAIQDNGTPATSLNVGDGWRANVAGTTQQSPPPVGFLAPGQFKRLDTQQPFSPVSFTTPPNISFMTITGSVSAENGNYSVSLDPKGTNLTPANLSYNGYSPWLSINQIKYQAILNPSVQYTVSMQLTATDGNKTDLSEITFYQATKYSPGPNTTDPGSGDGGSSSSGSKSNTGAIVGGVVGGVAALALLGILIWFFCFRKKKKTVNGTERFEIDDYQETTERHRGEHGRVEPFAAPTRGYGESAIAPADQSHVSLLGPGEVGNPPTTAASSSKQSYLQSGRDIGESTPFLGTATGTDSISSPSRAGETPEPVAFPYARPAPHSTSDPSEGQSSYDPSSEAPSSSMNRSPPPPPPPSHLASPPLTAGLGPLSSERGGSGSGTDGPRSMKEGILSSQLASPTSGAATETGGGGRQGPHPWQEVDAGEAPVDERGALPPGYDPTWAQRREP